MLAWLQQATKSWADARSPYASVSWESAASVHCRRRLEFCIQHNVHCSSSEDVGKVLVEIPRLWSASSWQNLALIPASSREYVCDRSDAGSWTRSIFFHPYPYPLHFNKKTKSFNKRSGVGAEYMVGVSSVASDWAHHVTCVLEAIVSELVHALS